MSELYKNHERCPNCDYWADRKEWTQLNLTSTDTWTGFVCFEYDTVDKESHSIGGVSLLSCPHCKTVIWNR